MNSSDCAGFSLIEFVLGMAIGLSVILATASVYQSQHQSWLLMQATASLHHNANAAFDQLQASALSANAVVLEGTDKGFVKTLRWTTHPSEMTEGHERNDSFSLGHFSVLNGHDCQGNHVDKHTQIQDSFQVNQKLELTCKDTLLTGSTYQAIAQGFEDFQLRYAEYVPPTTADSTSLWQWKNADQITDIANVIAIEICLRMVSTQPINAPPTNALGCRGEAMVNDGKLRRVFRRLVSIPSRTSLPPS